MSGIHAVKLAPSILAADFARLGEQVVEAEKAGADRIHVDVMDGNFVPNLSMGPAIVGSLRKVTRLPLETHLMVSDADVFLDAFASAGSDSLLVHWEGNNNLHRTVQRIKALGKHAGVAINPATPAEVLGEIVQDVDLVLVMTVNPGFGHQQFVRTTVSKIARVRELVDRLKPGFEWRWTAASTRDGTTGRSSRGATVLVAGSAIFGDREGRSTRDVQREGAGEGLARSCGGNHSGGDSALHTRRRTCGPGGCARDRRVCRFPNCAPHRVRRRIRGERHVEIHHPIRTRNRDWERPSDRRGHRQLHFLRRRRCAGAKPRAGFDVAVLRVEIDDIGLGSGVMAAAARLKPAPDGGVQIDDYAEQPVKLVTVARKLSWARHCLTSVARDGRDPADALSQWEAAAS
jgi:ribulose-phosphate 3-epimerase